MPLPSMQEQAVSDAWFMWYNPITDFYSTGTALWETENGPVIADITIMNDGTQWWDIDKDGWFDFASAYDPEEEVTWFFFGEGWIGVPDDESNS